MTSSVLQVNVILSTVVNVTRSDDTNATQVVTTSDNSQVTNFEGNVGNNLASGEINLDGIVGLDVGVRVSDGATVVSGEVRDGLGTNVNRLNAAELEASFVGVDSVENETTLSVVQESEVFLSLLDANNIHETSRIVGIASDSAIDLDQFLHQNISDLALGKSILQSVSQ